jgi:hypothetical protein
MKMRADVSRVRQCQIVKFYKVTRLGSEFEERLPKGEFVRRDIATKEYQSAPVVVY